MKWLGRAAGLLACGLLALWLFGPYEPAELTPDFDAAELSGGVGTYLNWHEARIAGITPGTEKQIIWAGAPETKAPWAVVYLHGFSATAQEIRPVPDLVAEGLGAHLVLTRLQGQGRGGDAMAEGTVKGWVNDTAEALAIARKTAERTLVLATSTGGTLAAAAAVDAAQMEQVAGIVLLSPNFAIKNPAARLLTWPAARHWLPLIAGERRSFEPLSEAQARYWTTEYPSVATLPMAALVQAVDRLDLGAVRTPALFIFDDADAVVDAEASRAAMAEWGAPVTRWTPALTPADDPSRHVIAGDIVSPRQTGAVSARILDWARGL